MKTLVIHPEDNSTDFLSIIYEDKNWTVINKNVSKSELKKQIKNHDRIVILGHGSEDGLYGFGHFVIDSNFVYLLREKQCVCIWCNADVFVKKYDLKGFYTGMIISEFEEAMMYCLYEISFKDIEQSSILFSNAIKQTIDSPQMLSEAQLLYKSDTNKIIMFNQENLYYR